MRNWRDSTRAGCTLPSTIVPSLATALSAANVGGKTITFPGVTMKANDSSWGAALASIAGADAVVLALGTDRSVAGEGTDRNDIGLPIIERVGIGADGTWHYFYSG